MLESHNDSAVAIAEAISGDVKAFADLMNQKAEEIGCEDTYFITPNGLDASDEHGTHSTTAVDLAKIMSYCIMESPQKERFLEITTIPQHSFQNIEGNRSYSCSNHNSFLTMMDEAISGKTGFTSDAGYCYVGAVESEGRTFVVALLACGWPNNKSYKWADMKTLAKYGMDNYEYETLDASFELEEIKVLNGIPQSGKLFDERTISVYIKKPEELSILLSQNDEIEVKVEQEEMLYAPVSSGDEVGRITYYLNGEQLAEYPIVSQESVKEKNFWWCFGKMAELYAIK